MPQRRDDKGPFHWISSMRPHFFDGFHRTIAATAAAGNDLIEPMRHWHTCTRTASTTSGRSTTRSTPPPEPRRSHTHRHHRMESPHRLQRAVHSDVSVRIDRPRGARYRCITAAPYR